MSDSQFASFGREWSWGWGEEEEAWEREVLHPDELEFPQEVEHQLAQVLAMDETDFDFPSNSTMAITKNTSAGGRGRKNAAAVSPEDVWEDLGLEDFVTHMQREQRLALSQKTLSGAGEADAEPAVAPSPGAEQTPTSSFVSQ